MSAKDKFVSFLKKKLPLPPDHVEGREYRIEAFQPDPTLPVDWGMNRWADVLDVIELKLGDPKIKELTGEGWEVSNLHKGSVQLVLKKKT